MNDKLKNFVWLAVGVALMWSVDFLLKNPENLLWQILPQSVLKLNGEMLCTLALTFGASIIAWFFALGIGILIGVVAAATVVERDMRPSWWEKIGNIVNKVYDGLYVIPFVLTVGFTYVLAQKAYDKWGLHSATVALIMIVVSGVVLGGWNIFHSIFYAVTNAKQENRFLVRSLFYGDERRSILGRWFMWVLRPMLLVRRLADCEINSFCEAVTRAFHLSIVAVMIVESVTPYFYENIFRSSGKIHAWTAGAGRYIFNIQALSGVNSSQVIAGFIWAVLIFDMLVVGLIQIGLNRIWLRHYSK